MKNVLDGDDDENYEDGDENDGGYDAEGGYDDLREIMILLLVILMLIMVTMKLMMCAEICRHYYYYYCDATDIDIINTSTPEYCCCHNIMLVRLPLVLIFIHYILA
jgi:hypothetical protein